MAKSRQTGDLVSDSNIFVDIANDRVGIGTTNPTSKLNVVDNSSSDAVRITQLGAGNAFVVEDSTNPDITPFVINAGGSVGIGTTIPLVSLHVAGNIRTSTLAGAGNRAVYSDPTGTLTNSSSDETLKENVLPITYGLDTVCQLNPIFFNWIDTERFGPQREIGLIAQQVQSLIPEVVGVNYDETLSLDYSKLTSVLIKSIQELKVENDLLRSEIEAIKQHVGITSINT